MTSNRFIYFILSAFIAGNLLLILVEYNSAKNLHNLITGNNKLQNELKVHNQLRELERDLLSAEIKIRGAAATNDSTYLDGVDLQIAEAKRHLDSLKQISEQDSTLLNIDRLSEVADEKLILKNRLQDSFYHSGKISQASFKTIQQHRKLTNEINNVSRKIYDSRQRVLDSLSISISSSSKKAQSWGIVMIILVLLSGVALFWYIINRIRRQNHSIQQLDTSERKVREVSMIKENFMANMSHEIRTPMNAILGFTKLLKSENQDPKLTEFVESIQKSGENLLTIINDILDLSKIEAGMMRIESAPFSVRGVIYSIESQFAEKIKEKGLDFSIVIDDSIPDALLGDATRLTQILVNMIGNAIKFTPQGAVHIEVSNKGMSSNYILTGFVISDTGIGIDKEQLSGIFERFRQAEDSTTRKYGGTGLGLSIVRDLIQLQKGEIDVESTKGQGTIFRFTIPYEIATGQLNILELPEADGADYPDLQHIHILIVDDNKMNQNLLKHLLKKWHFSLDIVNNGIESLECLQKKRYNLVLMDIQMPGMDGYTATQEIRLKLKLDIPIIAMTANAFASEREKCLSYGMNEYIAKPIDERELYRLIAQFTRVHGTHPEYEKNANKEDPVGYKFINLEYMQKISDGDKEYERTVTEQFLRAIPIDLETLESAFKTRDLSILRQTAHNMKTNISVMGLSENLQSYLDELEHEPFNDAHFQQIILSIKTICLNAIPEVRHFYSTL
jgi:signal transduction histidine kinase/CheY-like chemotaxis protein